MTANDFWKTMASMYKPLADEEVVSLGRWSREPVTTFNPFSFPQFYADTRITVGDIRRWASGSED